MTVKEQNAGLEKDVSKYELKSSEVLLCERGISRTSSRNSQKKRVNVLSRSMLSLLKTLKKCTETGYRMTMKKIKFLRYFPEAMLCCCDISEARDVSHTSMRLADITLV